MTQPAARAEDLPPWFDQAVNTPSTDGRIEVAGCAISYRVWGEPGRPGIILVHGNNAHLAWWQFTAPFLADQFRVTAIDLSGNGNSGWRETYSPALFAQEVMAVCEAAELGPRPFLVAHSMGGMTGVETAHRHGTDLGGVVFVDYTVRPPFDFENRNPMRERMRRPRQLRVYENFDTALGRFRLMPEQPCQHPYVVRHVGRYSLKQVDGGWTWKFDPRFHLRLQRTMDQAEKFKHLQCPTAVIVGEKSNNWRRDTIDHMRELAGDELPVIAIPGAYHHMMFDEPIAFSMALKGMLLAWRCRSSR